MLIGIDATAFSHPQPGGYKTYVTNLLAALQQTKSQHSFRVFLDREVSSTALSLLASDNGIVVSNRVPIIRQVLREQIQLPRQAMKEHCSVVHYTANTAPVFSRLPHVLTLHDVIALTEPQAPLLLSQKRLWQWMIGQYARHIIPAASRNCKAVITVSDFEKDQIVQHLKLSPDKIHPIHLAPSPLFYALPELEREAARKQVRNAYGLGPRYVLAIGHEPRKNVPSVLRAYSGLGASLQEQTGLLIVCARQHAQQALRDEIAHLHLDETVRVIGGVSPEDLLRLYNGAAVLMFPSLRESFGLPPLEAMACGTPVIASNTSSLPEILGDAALLVDPTDMPALTEALGAVLTNQGLADSLSERGLMRCRQFSWERTAQETIAVYESISAR